MVIVLKVSFHSPVKSVLLIRSTQQDSPGLRPVTGRLGRGRQAEPSPASARAVSTATRSLSPLSETAVTQPRVGSDKVPIREKSNTPPGHELGAVPPSFKAAPLRKQRAQTCGKGPQYPGYPGDPGQPGVWRAGGPPQAQPRRAAGAGAAPYFGSSDWSQCSVSVPPKPPVTAGHTHAQEPDRPAPPPKAPQAPSGGRNGTGVQCPPHTHPHTAVPRPP